MGSDTLLHLVNIRTDATRSARFTHLLKQPRATKDPSVAALLQLVGLTRAHTLAFRRQALPTPAAGALPDDEGFVHLAVGKWYGAEAFARWLCRRGFAGAVIQHSLERDGEAWGWEFEDGRIRHIALRPTSPWMPVRKSLKQVRSLPHDPPPPRPPKQW